MTDTIALLTITAASIGFLHTIIGPDHYLPFVLMSRSENWSRSKTMVVTFFCGLGHVLSSILIGSIGIAAGIALNHIELVESVRGEIAAWALIAFGILYGVWGLRNAMRNKPHTHSHFHADGTTHEHVHVHQSEHGHLHSKGKNRRLSTWALFLVFVLGPCEPLIPLLMFPAARESTAGVVLVASVFGLVTVATMMTMVVLLEMGMRKIEVPSLRRYMHAIAGGLIAASGLSIQLLGL